ncbi:ATP-binding protein [Prevotella communis]|uniref:ATP-binding protein n=1 Tax=Prevotella communis TaxID=2913614 RepID=UPI001EDAAFE0|nr:ATP-binding protein [Prevotella communis]UKK58624.1 ATP-binding protein [Prevotella communis]
MRHLNKIIFLNSANIPYAEVMLDGNVHFAGTQGVGKSTLLRALLFFYNADKMRLGIQQGQKSFEEFYFRYSNSYIVYEVKTENGAYSILTYRSQGKAVFRFIDAPYQKSWFVDESGRVESDWIRIRERIGSNDISAKIETYEQYRNIIFGNTHDRSHRYDKYAIVESSKYQNIPRSIQNVFLNSKLDADFVKNTIIQSMTDVEDSIRLSDYRHLVADFERELDEIDCWYRKDSNGEITVRNKAAKVVDYYRILVALEYEMKQTWHQLNHVVTYTREQLPLVEKDISEIQEKLKILKEKISAIHQDYENEHDRLTREISKREQRLDDIRKKRKYYNGIGIEDIIELNEQEQKFLSEKVQKEKILRALEEQYKDVTEKYRALYAALDEEWSKFGLVQKEELQRCRDGIQTERDKSAKVRDLRKKSVEDAFGEWLTASDDRLTVLQGNNSLADKRLSELQYWHPMEKETSDYEMEIQNLKTQEQQLNSQLTITTNLLKSMRQEWEMKSNEIKRDFEHKQEEAQSQLENLIKELSETEGILARWKGSFYEWLSQNKPGWEDTIGKVVDEQQVLYAQGLSPQLTGDSQLFGVSINLEAIPLHHRSPDEYRSLQKQQQEAVAAKKKEISELQVQLENDQEGLRKSYKDKIAELGQQETILKVQLEQIPTKIKDIETRIRLAEQKEKEIVAAEREKRTKVYNETLLALDGEKNARTQQRNKREKELRSADSEFNAAMKGFQNQFDAFKQKQAEEKDAKKKDIDERMLMLKRQERDELKGKGADTNALDLCRKDCEWVRAVLNKIDQQRHFVIEYRKDEEELFSHESEFRDEKRQLETKDSTARQQYEDKRKRYEAERKEHSELLTSKQTMVKAMKDGLTQYEQLCQVENILPEAFLHDDVTLSSTSALTELVVQMRGAVNKKRQKMEELKRATNSFNSHFGTNNTFHFITPQYDEDYLAFALNLQDFVENDKIEMYRSRVSDHYNTILRSVAREVGLLMNHSAEIRSIISEVNRDFQERNFAGVIRSIELRAEESSDRMMLLLRQIRDFTEENALTIGELNLFSGGDRDRVNEKVVEYLKRFMKQLQKEPARTELTLSDTFRLQFRIQENDNNTGWVERINNVGSDGTDILVKAMVNIMLINVFKTRASRKNGEFIIHCMMDEIGKLHPSNVSGILQFANVRNIYLINSSPMGYNADLYKYNYLLTKDGKSQTHIKRLMTINS